ncbi:MAG: zinc-binding alcohol dehydrogenase family protein [Nostoc sp.]|uniref:zinc-binding alcohol dehydrogenase family protein n=1 Tax=Nostoc sp. TaxID=1180 RepID=UPI002FF5877C
MKSLALCGQNSSWPFCHFKEIVKVESIPIYFGIVETQNPPFNPQEVEDHFKVFVKIKAFSCNYRDKAMLLLMNHRCHDSFYFIGSEFVGEVVEVGSKVNSLKAGDRVIANSSYPSSGIKGVNPGVATNHASARYQVFHEAKLVQIPPEIPDEVAAAFCIGAQTIYSIIRKLNLVQGANVLVTAAKSNTSLFAISALRKYNVNLYATTTSMQFEKELKDIGVKEVIQINPSLESFDDNKQLKNIFRETGGFDCVIDPFFDVHIGKVIDLMNFGSRYITCGLYDQHSGLTGKSFDYKGKVLKQIMLNAIYKNIHIIGNCLGNTDDLLNAIKDYTNGNFTVAVDSVFRGNQLADFVNRTYNDNNRFGKVVYQYD